MADDVNANFIPGEPYPARAAEKGRPLSDIEALSGVYAGPLTPGNPVPASAGAGSSDSGLSRMAPVYAGPQIPLMPVQTVYAGPAVPPMPALMVYAGPEQMNSGFDMTRGIFPPPGFAQMPEASDAADSPAAAGPAKRFCPMCGFSVTGGKFCSECGYKLTDSETT